MWPFGKKKRYIRIYNANHHIREWEILKESSTAYYVREVPDKGSFGSSGKLFEMWVEKDHVAIADVDGVEPIKVKKEGNIFTILTRR